jgi:hypothetical protein
VVRTLVQLRHRIHLLKPRVGLRRLVLLTKVKPLPLNSSSSKLVEAMALDLPL